MQVDTWTYWAYIVCVGSAQSCYSLRASELWSHDVRGWVNVASEYILMYVPATCSHLQC